MVKKQRLMVIVTVLLALGGASGAWWLTDHMTDGDIRAGTSVANYDYADLPEPELLLYEPLLPEQAKIQNDQLPFSNAPIERATPLFLPSTDLLLIGRRNAIDCLTSAIYYEAGNESAQGKRSVAQVILNRVRHPAFPNSICAVVYQGSERKTGCQFTFTCDGSLGRRPGRENWESARMIATGAISGFVEPSVGMATHYHANYVVPYWAPSLDKIVQIGTHIFYRWKGSWGRRVAFSQNVNLDRDVLSVADQGALIPITEELIASPEVTEKPLSRIVADDISSAGLLLTPSPELSGPSISAVRADESRPKLLADEQSPTLKSK